MTSNIYQKLAKAQQELGVLTKNQENRFFNSTYLTLDKITHKILPVLRANGLMLVQMPDNDVLVTQVVDIETGEKIESRCRLLCEEIAAQPPTINEKTGKPVAKNLLQIQGSAITYSRRYAIGAILQICTEPDDDGNSASGVQQKAANKKKETLSPESQRWEGALQALRDGRTSVAVILNNFDVPYKYLDTLREAENA